MRRLLAAVPLLLACTKPAPALSSVAEEGAPVASASTSVPPTATELDPAPGPWFQEWEVEDNRLVYAAVPVGVREKRPLVVGIHGAGDRAAWACSEWYATTAGWAFVVCPKGVGSRWPGTEAWSSAEQLATRADRAIAEMRKRYGRWIDDGPLVYAGWSQGGTLAGSAIESRPGVYDTGILVEVGHTPLDAGAVLLGFEKGGIRRAIVSCSSGNCRAFSKSMETTAKRRGLLFEANDVGNRGHVFDETVFKTLGPAIVRLVEGDPRWAGLGPAVAAKWGPLPDAGH